MILLAQCKPRPKEIRIVGSIEYINMCLRGKAGDLLTYVEPEPAERGPLESEVRDA